LAQFDRSGTSASFSGEEIGVEVGDGVVGSVEGRDVGSDIGADVHPETISTNSRPSKEVRRIAGLLRHEMIITGTSGL
jgi:hypothetical protein